jgi:hypothetical protein
MEDHENKKDCWVHYYNHIDYGFALSGFKYNYMVGAIHTKLAEKLTLVPTL